MRCPILVGTLTVLVLNGLAHAQWWGSLKGKVVLDGLVPENNLLIKGPVPGFPGLAGIPDDSLIIDPKTKGIANVLVWVLKTPLNIHPKLGGEPTALTMTIKDGRFEPRVLVLRTDQTVTFVNSDPVAYAPNIKTLQNFPVIGIVPANNETLPIQLRRRERLPAMVVCNNHNWMRAHCLIVDHPYATVTDKDGNFEIRDLPAGEHEFKIWHERVGYLVKHAKNPKKGLIVTIKAEEMFEVPEITIPLKTLTKAKK